MKLKHKLRLMLGATALTFAGIFAGLPAALANGGDTTGSAGTGAGTTVTNSVTLNYQVNSTAQTAVNASVTFNVDREIDLTVVTDDTAAVTVLPGTNSATATRFTITNLSNATLKFGLAASNTSGTTVFSDADSGDATTYTIYKDTSSTTSEATDLTGTAITATDALAPGATEDVWVVASSVPAAATNGEYIVVNLTATAEESDGTTLTHVASSGVDDRALDKSSYLTTQLTLFADRAGTQGGTAKDGKDNAYDVFEVSSAVLNVNKYISVVWDPVNGTTLPKAIPGAVVEYCLVISNTGGTQNATSVSLTDTLPSADLTYITTAPTPPTGVAQLTPSGSGALAVSGATLSGTSGSPASAPTSVATCTSGTAISSGLSGSGSTVSATGLTVDAYSAAYVVYYAQVK